MTVFCWKEQLWSHQLQEGHRERNPREPCTENRWLSSNSNNLFSILKKKTSCWPYWIFDSEVQVYLPDKCAKIFLCNVMQHYLKNSLVYIVKIFKSNLFRWKNFNWHYYYDYRSVLLLYSFFALICIQNQLLSILNQIKSILLYLWQGIHHQNMSEDIIRSSDKF